MSGIGSWSGLPHRQFWAFERNGTTGWYIDFERKKDKFGGAIAVVLLGRDIPVGSSTLSVLLGGSTYMDDWNDVSVLFDSSLDVPISRRWAWNNRFVLRFRSDAVVESNPQFNGIFSTGFTFKFTP